MSGGAMETQDERDEQPYFCYSATLLVFGTLPNLEELTQNLNLVPTHTHRRGELRTPSSEPYKQDMWLYEAPIDESEPLHVHIDALWASLRSSKQYLLSLKQNATVDVFCGYRSNSDTAGVEVPYQSLEIFTELRVPFGLSIIVV